PSSTPRRAASSGCSSAVGRASRAREVAVPLKLVLRKLRAGEVASLNGNSGPAASLTAQWSGSVGMPAQLPLGPLLEYGVAGQSARKWNLPSLWAKPSR